MSIYLLCGPPGSGKTTYVEKHKLATDLIVDMDALFVAFTGLDWYDKPESLLPIILDVRDFVINNLQRYEEEKRFYNAWIITTHPGSRHLLQEKIMPNETIIFEISPNECMQRISKDERRKKNASLWKPLIDKWWKNYVSCDTDKVISR